MMSGQVESTPQCFAVCLFVHLCMLLSHFLYHLPTSMYLLVKRAINANAKKHHTLYTQKQYYAAQPVMSSADRAAATSYATFTQRLHANHPVAISGTVAAANAPYDRPATSVTAVTSSPTTTITSTAPTAKVRNI